MADWRESSTKWFVLDDSPKLYVPKGKRAGMLKALEHLAREAGMCTARLPDGSMCNEHACQKHPPPSGDTGVG